jgi:hypothetical protein
MQVRHKIFFILIGLLIIIVSMLNHIRLALFDRHTIKKSTIRLKKTIDEGWFNAEIYEIQRTFSSPSITRCNEYFHDRLFVATIPIDCIEVNNLVLNQKQTNQISKAADFYFNTAFFSKDFSPISGFIHDNRQLSRQSPSYKYALEINEQGRLNLITHPKRSNAENIVEAPFTFTSDGGNSSNINRLNFRQFIAIKNGYLVFISGNGNSLIGKKDVQSLMKKKHIKKVIVLDGGASLNYCFKGKRNKYAFNSVPFRNIWFKYNSPYYFQGFIKK